MHKSARCTPKKMLEILNEYFLKLIGVLKMPLMMSSPTAVLSLFILFISASFIWY